MISIVDNTTEQESEARGQAIVTLPLEFGKIGAAFIVPMVMNDNESIRDDILLTFVHHSWVL